MKANPNLSQVELRVKQLADWIRADLSPDEIESEILNLLHQQSILAKIDELNNIPYSVETNPHVNKRLAELKSGKEKI